MRTATAAGVFNPVVLQMIAVGEESGALDSLMFEIAEMYERPRSLFVAQFLGESNLLDGRSIGEHEGMLQIELAGGAGRICAMSSDPAGTGAIRIMVRPESLVLTAAPTPGWNSLPGSVAGVEFLGASIRYAIDTAAGPLSVRVPRTADGPRAAIGDRVTIMWRPADTLVFPQ